MEGDRKHSEGVTREFLRENERKKSWRYLKKQKAEERLELIVFKIKDTGTSQINKEPRRSKIQDGNKTNQGEWLKDAKKKLMFQRERERERERG